MILLLAILSPALACPELNAALDGAVVHILSADSATTALDFEAAEASLACAQASPAQIARYFLVRGGAAELALAGSGAPWFGAAKAIDGAVWVPELGPDLKRLWEEAGTSGEGSLNFDTNREGGWVDGAPVQDWPARIWAGWHVVQIITTDGKTVMYGRSLHLPDQEVALVQTGLPEMRARAAPETAGGGTIEKKRRLISPAWLIASGVVAAAGGGLAAGAKVQSGRMPLYDSVETLDTAWTRQQQFAVGAYACWGAAGVLGGLSFVLP